jgi:hypothetical protein
VLLTIPSSGADISDALELCLRLVSVAAATFTYD